MTPASVPTPPSCREPAWQRSDCWNLLTQECRYGTLAQKARIPQSVKQEVKNYAAPLYGLIGGKLIANYSNTSMSVPGTPPYELLPLPEAEGPRLYGKAL